MEEAKKEYSFDGTYNYSIDQRKRVFIPAEFRNDLGDEFIVCTPLGGGKCVVVYPIEEWDKYYAKVQATFTGINRTMAERYLSSNKKRVVADKQGRITLTEDFCKTAELLKDAKIVGVSNRIEIWNPDNWQAELDKFCAENAELFKNLSL